MKTQTVERLPSMIPDTITIGSESRIGGIMLHDFIQGEENNLVAFFDPEYPQKTKSEKFKNVFAPELDQDPVIDLREMEGSEGFFNVTALNIGGAKYIFGRRVQEAAPDGQPDSGLLALSALDSKGNIAFFKEVWNPEGKDVLLEDPRALQAADGKTTIGITAVMKAKGNKTFPGVIILDSAEMLLTKPLPEARIIEKFGGGDQTTPLGGMVEGKNATSIGENLLMYRPDGLNHTLQVLEYSGDDAKHVCFIEFPEDIPWATYKIGTTSSPIWLNDHEAFFVIHGLNKTVNGEIVDPTSEDENVIYEYSIGTARLQRHADEMGNVSFSVDNISLQPIITPDSFPERTDGRPVELHPEIRRVDYCCGDEEIRNTAGELVGDRLFVNQGDKRVYTAVVAVDIIVPGWDRTTPHLNIAA